MKIKCLIKTFISLKNIRFIFRNVYEARNSKLNPIYTRKRFFCNSEDWLIFLLRALRFIFLSLYQKSILKD